MAAPTNTATTLSQTGNREDLTDILERVAPEATPLMSNIGAAGKAKANYHEWQTEDLATPSADGVLEGDDTTSYEENVTSRLGNHTQIFKRAFVVSGTQEVVNKAGRSSELARHRVLKSTEIKRDVELALMRNGASRVQSGSNPRLSGGALAWCETNVDRGTGGSNGGFDGTATVDAATNGTQRAFAKSQVDAVMRSIFTNSGQSKRRHMYMSPFHKDAFAAFSGITQIQNDVTGRQQAVIYGAADMYMSSYGPILTIPHPYALTRDVFIADHQYMGVSTLRAMKEEKLAKTGDNEKRHILCEKTLCVKNEKALGVIADLSTS